MTTKIINFITWAHKQEVHRGISTLVAVLVLAAVVTAGVSAAYTNDLKASLKEQAAEEQRLLLEHQSETLNLALEFGYDPLIVEITRAEAKQAFRQHACNKCMTWRFVHSDKDLAYLVLSIIQTESRGDNAAMNPGGPAYGLTQLLLSTAQQYDPKVKPAELYAVPKHLHIAVEHFVNLLERFNGNYTLAIIAWNRGAGGVDRSIAIGSSPENGYARQVFMNAALRNAKRD